MAATTNIARRIAGIFQAPRAIAAVLAAISFAAVAIAVGLQLAYDWYPCPWCILQRYAFLALGGFMFVRALVPDDGRRAQALNWASALVAVTGVCMASFQLYVMFNPKASCGRDAVAAFVNDLPTARVWPTVFEATGSCADPIPVNFPVLALLGFVALGVCVYWLCRRR